MQLVTAKAPVKSEDKRLFIVALHFRSEPVCHFRKIISILREIMVEFIVDVAFLHLSHLCKKTIRVSGKLTEEGD